MKKYRTVESLAQENEALRIEMAAIRRSADHYKALYEALPVSLEVVDKDGTIVGVNPFHLANMGRGKTTLADYVGKYIVTRPSIVASGLADKIAAVLQGTPFEADEVHFPALSGGGDGYFNLRGLPLVHEGEIVGAIFISVDVTAQRKAREELRSYSTRLEELVEERTSELSRAVTGLQEALARVSTLSGLLPICASCRKIRDDKGYWSQLEAYVLEHSDVQFSHGICPECTKKLYPGLLDQGG